MSPSGSPGRDKPDQSPRERLWTSEPPEGDAYRLPPCFLLPRRAGSTRPFSAERSHGESGVARLLAAIRRHPSLTAGCGHPPWAKSEGGCPALGSGGRELEGAGEGWLGGGQGLAAARNTPLNTSRPVGPRPQEASEARGCT